MSKYLKTLNKIIELQNTRDTDYNKICESVSKINGFKSCFDISCDECVFSSVENTLPILKILNDST